MTHVLRDCFLIYCAYHVILVCMHCNLFYFTACSSFELSTSNWVWFLDLHIKFPITQDMMPCKVIHRYICFRGDCCLCLQGSPAGVKNWYYVGQGIGDWSGSPMGHELGTVFHIIHKTIVMPFLNSIRY